MWGDYCNCVVFEYFIAKSQSSCLTETRIMPAVSDFSLEGYKRAAYFYELFNPLKACQSTKRFASHIFHLLQHNPWAYVGGFVLNKAKSAVFT